LPDSEDETEETSATVDNDSAAAEEAEDNSFNDQDPWVLVESDSPLLRYLPDTGFGGKYHIAIVGVQGAGKTTLVTDLRAIAELVQQTVIPGAVQLTDQQFRDLEIAQELASEADAQREAGFNLTEQQVLQHRQHLIDTGLPVDQPGVANDDRNPTPWQLSDTVMLWDMPGAGTKTWPAATVVDDMGLRDMSAVVVVVGLQESEAIDEMVAALHEAQIPIVLVQTHFDQYLHKQLSAQHRAWLATTPPEEEAFLTPEMVDVMIRQRRSELRKIYFLEKRDYVHCVNLQEPVAWVRFEPFRGSNYEMRDMHDHIFEVARAAHV
jgi:hypothetical protein